jgi:hypothetical protein
MGKHSDFYVKIPLAELSAVQIRQLLSEKDGSIAVPEGTSGATAITGITEWVGSWHSETVTVGWDWGVVDGLVVLLNPQEIRTNIQLIAADERPLPAKVAQMHLFHWIESLPWREVAVNNVLPYK